VSRYFLTGYIILRNGVDIIGILGLLTGIDRPSVAIFVESRARGHVRMTGPGREIVAFHAGLSRKCNTERDEYHQRYQK
jgi:hypothetical protein